ncbi:MAG TPA: RNase P subunit p30 family protein [Candidatus Norongarragalinales archaeon]|jgi:ribonuclease P/MRP protein subunit RPP1|nr:RNase P subunit p30 family protein [Candidatus Norongarragalinales archaeon]
MKYYDLHCPNQLEEKAAELGWTKTIQPRLARLYKHSDLPPRTGELVIAESEDPALLVHALKNTNVTAVYPFLARDLLKNDELFQTSADFAKPFEIRLYDLLNSSGHSRAQVMARTKSFLAKSIKRKAPFIITSAAKTTFDLKTPKETITLATLFGLTEEQAEFSISKQCEKTLATFEK